MDQTIEIIKISISALIPITILFLGVIINKTLEKNKNILTKEKEWQIVWSEKLLSIATEYSSNISMIVCQLFSLVENSNNDEIKKSKVDVNLQGILEKSRYLNWEIQNYSQFAYINGKGVKENSVKLQAAIGNLINQKWGNLEEIRNLQFNFNKSVRDAHAEILGINA